jgi:hypothetical protein
VTGGGSRKNRLKRFFRSVTLSPTALKRGVNEMISTKQLGSLYLLL